MNSSAGTNQRNRSSVEGRGYTYRTAVVYSSMGIAALRSFIKGEHQVLLLHGYM